MNLGEILEFGGKIMILGLFTVFIALAGIILVVSLISKAVNIKVPTRNNVKANITQDNNSEENQSTDNTSIKELQTEDMELIAVITAAVAASLNRSTHNVIVRKVERITSTRSQWSKAGRYEYISSKL